MPDLFAIQPPQQPDLFAQSAPLSIDLFATGDPLGETEEPKRGLLNTLLHEVGRDIEGATKTVLSPFGEVAEAFGLEAPVTFEDLDSRDLTGAAMIASMFVGGAALQGVRGAAAARAGIAGASARGALPFIGSKVGHKAVAAFTKDLGFVKRAAQAALAEGSAGTFFGGVRPLEGGEERLDAIISDTALFGGLGAGFSMIGSAIRETVGVKLIEMKEQAKNAAIAQIARREEARKVLREFAGVKLRNPESGKILAIRRYSDGKVRIKGAESAREFNSFSDALSESLEFGYTENVGFAQNRLDPGLKAFKDLDPASLQVVKDAAGDVEALEMLKAADFANYQGVRGWARKNWEQAQELSWLSASTVSESVNEFGEISLKDSERRGIISLLEGDKATFNKMDDGQLVRESLKQGKLSLQNIADGVEMREMVKEIFINDRFIGEGVAVLGRPSYDTTFFSRVMTPQFVAKLHPEVRPLYELSDAGARAAEQGQRHNIEFINLLKDRFPMDTMKRVAKIVDETVVSGDVKASREAAIQAARESGDDALLKAVTEVTDRLNLQRLRFAGAGRLGEVEASEATATRARQILAEATTQADSGAAAEARALELAQAEGIPEVVQALIDDAGRAGYFPISHQIGNWRLSLEGLPKEVEYQLIHESRESALKEMERVMKAHGARNASVLPNVQNFDGGTMHLVEGSEFGKMIQAIRSTEGVELTAKEAGDLLKEAGVGPSAGPTKFTRFLQERRLGWRDFTEDPYRTLEFYLHNTEKALAFNEYERNAKRIIDAIPDNKSQLKVWAEDHVRKVLGRPTQAEEASDAFIHSVRRLFGKEEVAPRATRRYLSFLRRVAGVSRLGGFMSGLVNSSQILINTVPLIGTKYTAEGLKKIMTPQGFRQVRKLFAEEGIDLGMHMNVSREGELIAGESVKQDIISALKRTKMGETKAGLKAGVEALERMWMFAFNGAERLNRTVTAWGAYKKGLADGMDKTAALTFARETVEKTQFNYRISNIPTIMAGPIGGTLMQFKTFFINEIQLIASVDAKTRLKMMAAFSAAGGAGAVLDLPGPDLVNAASTALFDKRVSETLDIEGGSEDAPALTRLMTFGAPGLIGADLSQYIGPGGFAELTWSWAGPVASDIGTTTRFLAEAGSQFLKQGSVNEDTYNAFFQKIVPSQIRRIMRGHDIVKSGEVRNPYTRKLIYKPQNRLRTGAMQMLGPPTARMAKERALDDIVTRQVERYRGQSSSYGRQIGIAANNGNMTKVRELVAEARDHGINFEADDIKRWQRNMGRSAAERRERRTPLDLREDLLRELQ